MIKSSTCTFVLVAGLLFSPSLHAANWPAWRGPHGTGVCDEKNLPLNWSATNHVRWKTPVHGRAWSCPVI